MENNYGFPFSPYPQQLELMNEIYSTIENSKVGIFESPTGTGKSLSILCSTVSWILKNQQDEMDKLSKLKVDLKNIKEDKENEVDWIFAQTQKKKTIIKIEEEIGQLAKRKNILDWIKQTKQGKVQPEKSVCASKEGLAGGEPLVGNSEDDEFIVEYDSDTETLQEEDKEDAPQLVKVFYCSRTHSQLSQVVRELSKTDLADRVVVTSLGSRHNLCVDAKVRGLASLNLVNERCRDLQQTAAGCRFKVAAKVETVRKEMTRRPLDIEDLANEATRLGGCAFYAARTNVPAAQVVLLPYQNVLNPAARAASGIRMAGNLLVIDEAHNLSDTVSAVNSVMLPLETIQLARTQLGRYFSRYLTRLSATSLQHIRQLSTLLNNLHQFVSSDHKQKSFSLDTVDFLFKACLDKFRLDSLLRFIDHSKLSFKLRGFLQQKQMVKPDLLMTEVGLVKRHRLFQVTPTPVHDSDVASAGDVAEKTSNAMMVVINFLAALHFSLDARVLVETGVSVHFLVVDPGKYLTDLLNEARSTIVIGGTMQPFSEFRDRLFGSAGCDRSRVSVFSCGHVVDASSQLLLMPLGRLKDVELKFNFQMRSNTKLLSAGGEALVVALRNSPNGCVVFLSSYNYLSQILQVWRTSTMMAQISELKTVFVEPRSANQLESLMREYSRAARSKKGAVLFAVIGGKMSEGINFDDELARLVVVVGVPYPNIQSAVLQEKRRFVENSFGADAGKVMYENLAMKAVNQAIGRAIRHRLDFAAVLLLDIRYESIVRLPLDGDKLSIPGWMRPGLRSVEASDSLAQLANILTSFFNTKTDLTSQ